MTTRHWLIIIMLVLGSQLYACGQKGALYLPDDKPQQEQEEEQQ